MQSYIKKTKIIDMGWDSYIRELNKIDGSFTKVGFPDQAQAAPGGSSSMTEVQKIAAVHEFGAPNANIPERSFLRAGYDANVKQLNAIKIKMYNSVLDGRIGVKKALGTIGEWLVSRIRAFIRDSSNFVPLSELTIYNRSKRSKGSDKPLIDTGQMIQSITHVEEIK